MLDNVCSKLVVEAYAQRQAKIVRDPSLLREVSLSLSGQPRVVCVVLHRARLTLIKSESLMICQVWAITTNKWLQ